MPEYSDAESVSSSESESESDCEQIEAVLKKVPKQKAPEVKPKRTYVRKKPIADDDMKVMLKEKLQKARDAKTKKANEKKQEEAQEKAELAELKKLKDSGKLKVKKSKPTEISIPKKKREKVVVKEIHHYHDAKPVATEPAPAPKQPKQVRPPKPPAMVFA